MFCILAATHLLSRKPCCSNFVVVDIACHSFLECSIDYHGFLEFSIGYHSFLEFSYSIKTNDDLYVVFISCMTSRNVI